MDLPAPDFAERHLARLVDSSDDAIVSKDLDGIILSWNAAAMRLFGYSAEEAVGRSIRLIIPQERQAEEDYVLAQIRNGESVRHYETMRRRKDGTLIPIELTVSPVYDDQGRVIGASKIARDISERQRLQREVQEQAAVARQLGEVGTLVARSLDRTDVVQQVTDAATALTDAEFGAFLYNVLDPTSGESYMLYTLSGASRDAFAHLPQPRTTAVFAPTFRGAEPVRLDDVTADPRYGQSLPHFGMPAGHLPVRSYLAVPVVAHAGDVRGGLFFGHSRPGVFTLRHEQLATGVANWAALALENARLYAEAREADRLKDEFLAVLSHELRTPLNAILGYARLIRGGVLTGEKAERGFETLERNATALTQIVDDVLDVSRIVAGKIRLNVQPVDLPLVVHNAVATIQPAATAKGIRLDTVVDPRVGPISGDPDRLQQVLWNLLSNAVKFTLRGGRVQLRVERVDSHVEISISDTGIGIRSDFLPHVFERFRQAESGPSRNAGGLGLGLSIVKHLVEMHGGAVFAASDGESQGATFRVCLPTMIVHGGTLDPARQHPATGTWEPTATLADLRGTRILALDDEADAIGLLRAVLEAAGAEVAAFSSAQRALEQLATIAPDVMVVDLGMPEMDGFAFISRVRASENTAIRDVPAAALTAFARSDDRTRALQAGFELHLAKPVDPAELVAAIVTLNRQAARAQSHHRAVESRAPLAD